MAGHLVQSIRSSFVQRSRQIQSLGHGSSQRISDLWGIQERIYRYVKTDESGIFPPMYRLMQPSRGITSRYPRLWHPDLNILLHLPFFGCDKIHSNYTDSRHCHP